jgi:hypothetical protein
MMNASPSPKLTSKLSVFLSYRSVEARFADVLKQHLVHDFIGMIDVFLASDTTSIPAGSSWHAGIIQGLHRADLHIVICSSVSVQCPWINYEAGAAAVRATPIVPLCHSGLLPRQLPVPLSESEGGVITDATTLRRVYDRIAGLIGSAVPDVDFGRFARDFIEVQVQLSDLMEQERVAANEAADAISASKQESIKRPRVICVTSPQFKELGYANQLSLVLSAFPKTIEHDFVLSSTELRKALLEDDRQTHILHIAAFVCPRGGDLYFTPVRLPLGDSAVDEPDMVTPEALVSLLERAKTRLVVLGASASLVLGAQLLAVANVIAVRDMVSPPAMASWVETFYRALLKEEPLPAAFDLATRVSQAPMRLYGQQRHAASLKLAVRDLPEIVT